nr:RecName: Full=Unknown protein 8 [Pinus halepensis]
WLRMASGLTDYR